jgi:hypothetical protein
VNRGEIMHKDILVFLDEHTTKARQVVDFYLEDTVGRNYEGIIGISGISGTGKSEVASECNRILYEIGISSFVINMDKYYRVNADVRNKWRKEECYIGHKEIDWYALDKEIKRFRDNKIKVLIVEGLYSNYITGAIKFYIEGNIESSDEFRLLRGKEIETDPWRQYVVGEEYADILESLQYCNYTI